MRAPRFAMSLIALLLLAPATSRAQEAPVGPAESTAITTDRGDLQRMRDRLHLLLLRPDVRRTARDHDIDLRPLHQGIDGLGPAALARIAPHADAVEATRSQSAVTISTTTIIIALLVVILLVLLL